MLVSNLHVLSLTKFVLKELLCIRQAQTGFSVCLTILTLILLLIQFVQSSILYFIFLYSNHVPGV